MTDTEKKLLEEEGWAVECESPFEIRHADGSFASGQAADIVLHSVVADAAAGLPVNHMPEEYVVWYIDKDNEARFGGIFQTHKGARERALEDCANCVWIKRILITRCPLLLLRRDEL